MANKIILLVLCFTLIACKSIGGGTYVLWFDPRGDEFEKQQKKDAEKEKQDEIDRVERIQTERADKKRREEMQAQRELDMEARRKDEELQRQESAIKRKEAIETRQRQLEESRKQQEAMFEQRRRQAEIDRVCASYQENNCRNVPHKTCVAAKQCKVVSGSPVCWDGEQCSTTTSLVCTGKKPEGCKE